MILEIFNEKTQLLFLKMWKMFGSASSVSHVSEDYYESVMTYFINVGVVASEELHGILINYLPESQQKGFSLQTVDAN